MSKTLKGLSCAALLAVLLAACAEDGTRYGPKRTVGGAVGAAAGGLLGSKVGSGKGQLAGTAVGALVGLLIGSEIGRTMDDVDRLKSRQALNKAARAPIGNTIAWNNLGSGNSGTIKATRDGTSSAGEYCREFQQRVTVARKTEQAYGIACRQPDGTWKIRQ